MYCFSCSNPKIGRPGPQLRGKHYQLNLHHNKEWLVTEDNMHVALFRVRDGFISAQVAPSRPSLMAKLKRRDVCWDKPWPSISHDNQCHMHFLTRQHHLVNYFQFDSKHCMTGMRDGYSTDFLSRVREHRILVIPKLCVWCEKSTAVFHITMGIHLCYFVIILNPTYFWRNLIVHRHHTP